MGGGQGPRARQDQVRIEIDVSDRAITVLECRPPWRGDDDAEWTRLPVARMRYVKNRDEWTLYWPDRNSDFHEYDLVEPSPDIQDLLDEIDADPTAIFRG